MSTDGTTDLDAFPDPAEPPAPASGGGPMKVCAYCGVSSTPVWRTGPNKEPLCNKCGLQAARKRRKREAASQQDAKSPGEAKAARAGLGGGGGGGGGKGGGAGHYPATVGAYMAQAATLANGAGRQGGFPAGASREGPFASAPAAGPSRLGSAIPSGFSSLSGVHIVVLPPSDPVPASPGGAAAPGAPPPRTTSPPAPRLVQNATLVLEDSGGPAPLSHPTCLPVCLAAYDNWGQRLLASERFDVMPHLEYDPAYGCFVYDSGQDWWLLLPRAEQTEVFKALMHKFAMMKAVRMGLLPRPQVELSLDGPPLGTEPLLARGGEGGAGAGGAGPSASATLGADLLGRGPAAPNPGGGAAAQRAEPPAAALGAGAAGAAGAGSPPDLMMALSGLLAGAGWGVRPEVGQPAQRAGRAEQPAEGLLRPLGGGSGGWGGAGSGGRGGAEEEAMRVLGSLTALGSGLNMPLANDLGGPTADGGSGAGGGGAGGKGPLGSLDFADLWDPALTSLNTRALSGLTQALLGMGGGSGAVGEAGGGTGNVGGGTGLAQQRGS